MSAVTMATSAWRQIQTPVPLTSSSIACGRGEGSLEAATPASVFDILEEDPPPGREPIDWKLVTNLPVGDLAAAVEKLGWYALRWKAEVFRMVMKSGCHAEEARLETVERLTKFLTLIAVVNWCIFFVTMSARAKPDAAPDSVLIFAKISALDRIDASRTRPRLHRRPLAACLLQIAMLGGSLDRNRDPPPGNIVVWRGMTRLHDFAFGISIGSSRRCG